MQLYIVIGGAEGKKALAVFSTRERALTFVEERGVQNAWVEERSLPAGYTYPTHIYGAHEIGSDGESLQFIDLFLDQREAETKAGRHGKVLTLKPDNKAVEDIH